MSSNKYVTIIYVLKRMIHHTSCHLTLLASHWKAHSSAGIRRDPGATRLQYMTFCKRGYSQTHWQPLCLQMELKNNAILILRKNAVCGGKLHRQVNHLGDPIPMVEYGGGSIMLWGCFSSVGAVKLVRENRRIDGDKYRELLEGNLLEAAPAEQWPSTHNQSYSKTYSRMV